MSRKQFIQSNGATCKNWTWSWSFVNHSERFVIFGTWDRFTNGKLALILSEEWEFKKGRKSNGYKESLENIRLIADQGYRLMTFPMEYAETEEDENGQRQAMIGGFIPELSERKLTRVGNAWYGADSTADSSLSEELPISGNYLEGAKVAVTINAYERSAAARAACIARHGLNCAVCGYNFGVMFGELGRGFIHVHHIVPIGQIGEEYQVDPVNDLVPVCPNCHAMIHRTVPPLTIDQLQKHLAQTKSGDCQ